MKTRFKKSEIASNGVKRLRIFVASPKDCSIERNTIRQLVTTNPTIRTIARELNVIPEIYGWEDVCPNGGRPQQVINAAIEKFNPDWFVFLFWHRLGSDAGEGITGTEEEWRLAQQYNQARGKDVSIYFNQASPPSYEIDGYQLEAVKRFREDIFCNFQALAKDFDGPKDFEEQVSAHLSEKLISRSTGIAQQITDIPSRLLDISAGLLKWPTTLGNGKQLDRPQLQTILRRFEELESSATIILGPPGSGKSAFLATLAKALQTCGTFLIAIKADQLGSNVDTLEDLRHWLDLPIGLREAILTLSNRNPVVLLVDQLDAVSELLDRKSGRLNLLLDLIHSLAGHRNVHIVASSREFEFRHDIRLSNIDAERVDLDAPTWEQIAKLLSEVGIREETIGEPLKRLLLLPLNLKIFLDIGASNATFESHHALLEELWKQRVVSADGVEGSELLLQLLVDRMSTEETLWLPSAVADGYRAARQALEQADVLTKGQNGLIIGFRHQTYYDFTLARAFARGSRSLSNDVLERQDGLFVRPSLISGLNYLRAAARREYHKQLSILMTSQLRLHLRTLIIEVLGEQNDPDGVEAEIMLPLLASEHEGPRVLRSVANSIGWFARLKKQKEFLMWLRMPPDKAAHCVPLLSSAIHYDPETCVNLIAHFWKGNELFDSLTLAVLQQKKDWDRHGVELVCTIARRTQLQWAIENIAESVADSVPALAPMIIRADYDRRLEKALKDLEEPVPELSADADRQQRLIHEMAYEKSRPVRQILEDKQGWENLEEFGVRAPKAFLDQLWPWFLNAVTQMAEDEHAFVIGYRHDPLSYRSFEGDLEPAPLVGTFLKIITDLATKDADTFLEFMMANESSEFLIVHRLLSRGLEALAFQNAQAGLEYLAGDPRRLILGDLHDSQVETKRLIRAVSSRLNDEGKQKLEHIVLAYSKYKRVLPEWSAKEKLQRRRWDRRARLDLLRAIPVESLSANTRKIRSEEELVFPETRLPFEDTRSSSGWVGPRMTAKEMGHASDDDLLRLFNELPDSVGWDNPKRTWSQDMSRAGGAIQLSRELSELAKQAPDRVLSLISHLQPQVHEQYAGEAVKGLIGTDLPTEALLRIMEDLDNRGFHSTEFRDDIASAAEGLANRNNGLPEEFLRRLQAWLADEPKPIWPEPSDSRLQQHDSEKSGSILYESGGFSTLTHARGSITRAIADGYLKRNPPDVKEWSRFVESRLTNEKHPQIWAEILTRMVILFQGDRRRATILFDQAIKACPDVFHYPLTLHAIARVLRGIEPKDIGESWLESLLADGSSFCQQAYGELLPLFNCFHQDSGSMDRLATYLQGENRIAEIDRGLAYAATYIWTSQRCRDVARLILCTLASSNDKTVHSAVACLFRLTRDNFELDDDMRRIIYKAASNPPLLLLSSQDLVETLEPLTGTEPKLVAHVCEQILRFGSEEITQPGSSWIYVASGLTNIALTLHRQTAYRETGLKLFEELIALNVREAKDAIELLDRRPIIGTDNSRRRRWRRRPRRVRRTAGL